MLPNVKGSGDGDMGGKGGRHYLGKKKRCRLQVFKLKGTLKKQKNNEIQLGDSEGEEDVPINWQDYEVEALIVIHNNMEA